MAQTSVQEAARLVRTTSRSVLTVETPFEGGWGGAERCYPSILEALRELFAALGRLSEQGAGQAALGELGGRRNGLPHASGRGARRGAGRAAPVRRPPCIRRGLR